MNNSSVRNRATTRREESATSEGEEFTLREAEQQGNDATRRSLSVHSESSDILQQLSNPQHLSSWICILVGLLTVIPIIIVARFAKSPGSCDQTIEQLQTDYKQIRQSLDSRDQTIEQLQKENKQIRQSLDSRDQTTEQLQKENKQIRQSLDSRDQTIEQLQNENKENLSMVKYLQNELAHMKKALQDSKSQCNSDILKSEERCFDEQQDAKEIYRTVMHQIKEKYQKNMDQIKEEYRINIDETRDKCRSDMDQAKEKCREDKGNQAKEIEYKIRLLIEDIDLLIECLARKQIAPAGNIFSAVFNIIWGAVETGFGWNRDVEYCLEQFNERFQRRLPA